MFSVIKCEVALVMRHTYTPAVNVCVMTISHTGVRVENDGTINAVGLCVHVIVGYLTYDLQQWAAFKCQGRESTVMRIYDSTYVSITL